MLSCEAAKVTSVTLNELFGSAKKRISKNSIVLSVMLRHLLIFFAAPVDGVPLEPVDGVPAKPPAAQGVSSPAKAL